MNTHRGEVDRRVRGAVSLYLKGEISVQELSRLIDHIIAEVGAAQQRIGRSLAGARAGLIAPPA